MTSEPCPDCGVMLNRSPNYGRCRECGRVSTLCLAVDNEQPREQYLWPVAKRVDEKGSDNG